MPSTRFIFIVFLIVFSLQIPAGWIMQNISLSIGIIINQIIIMVAIPLAGLKISGYTFNLRPLFKRPANKTIAAMLLAAIFLAIISDYIVVGTEYLFPIPKGVTESLEKLITTKHFTQYLSKIALLAVLPAVCEEIFFRGICQTALVARFGKMAGLIIATALFAIAHTNLWYIHLYFILGLFLGFVFEKSGSLWLSVICHLTNNLWTVTNSYIRH